MKKNQKKLIVFSPVEELRFFHFGREQSIHGLRSTHFIFETEILLQRQITSRLNGLTQTEILTVYEMKAQQHSFAIALIRARTILV